MSRERQENRLEYGVIWQYIIWKYTTLLNIKNNVQEFAIYIHSACIHNKIQLILILYGKQINDFIIL